MPSSVLQNTTVLWRKLTEINFGVKTGDSDCCYDIFKLVYKLLSDFQKSEKELAKQTATISSLTNNTNAEVSQFEEKVFRCILTKKENLSEDGLIRVKNCRGRPLTLTPVRVPEVPSSEASARTVRERSRFQENLLAASVSVQGQSQEKKQEDLNLQRTSLIRRDKENLTKCAKEAGVKILAKFSPSQAAGLKKELSFETWRVVKRALSNVTGTDILGTEKQLRNEMDKSYFEYECGTFKTVEKECEKSVTFVRVTNLQNVITKTVQQLQSTGELCSYENIPGDCLKVLVCGDKGSQQTKLMLSVLNSKLQHSVKRAKLIAIFERARDSPECIQTVSTVLTSRFWKLTLSAAAILSVLIFSLHYPHKMFGYENKATDYTQQTICVEKQNSPNLFTGKLC